LAWQTLHHPSSYVVHMAKCFIIHDSPNQAAIEVSYAKTNSFNCSKLKSVFLKIDVVLRERIR